MRLLLVDDDASCRLVTGLACIAAGHEVHTSANGRDAIDRGLWLHADVAVVDWMLRGDLHGLHVIEALRAARPELRALILTGYPHDDVAVLARDLEVGLAHKPIEPDALVARIATLPVPTTRSAPRFGVVGVDATGAIAWSNPVARRLLRDPDGAARLVAALTRDAPSAARDWVPVDDAFGGVWRARIGPLAGDHTRVAVVLPPRVLPRHPVVELLLGDSAPRPRRWPGAGRVLIVDDSDTYRSMVAAMLGWIGVTCFGAATHASALAYLQEDPGIELALLDWEMPDGELANLVPRIRALRPDVQLVGNSGNGREAEFRALGVDRYLAKPWRLEDLIAVASDLAPAGGRR